MNLYVGLLKSLSCLYENYLLEQGPTTMLAENSINMFTAVVIISRGSHKHFLLFQLMHTIIKS